MTRLAGALAVLLILSCKEKPAPPPLSPNPTIPAAPPPVTAPREAGVEIGDYPPPPLALRRFRCAIPEFSDKTLQQLGPAATDQLETLVGPSNRFSLIGRKLLKALVAEQGLSDLKDPVEILKPGRLRGVDYAFVGTITRFQVAMSEKSPGPAPLDVSKMAVRIDVGLDVRLVNTTTGEIVAKEMGEISREGPARAWGIRVLGVGGPVRNGLKVDPDSQGRILRWALDETFRRMLPAIDEAFSRTAAVSCPKCKTEIAAGVNFCGKCGVRLEDSK